jgi:hypothetical protein
MWVAIWATFFLCQCLPVLYLVTLVGSQLLLLAGGVMACARAGRPDACVWEGAEGGRLVAWHGVVATAVTVAFASRHMVRVMLALSERYQLDFWRTHLN